MKLVSKKNEEKYSEFLRKHRRCNFQQSIEWGRVKSNWKNEIVIVESNAGKIIGSISVLIRRIPIFGNLMYSPRGPVCDIHDEEVLRKLTEGLRELANKYQAFLLLIEPDIKSSDKEFRKIISDIGYKIKDTAKDFNEEIQPRFVFRLDIKNKTCEQVFADFHPKTRYNIKLAMKKGVTVKEGTKEDLKEFYRIMQITGKRDNFMIRPLEYFEKMYDELVKIGHMKLMMAYYEGKPIAGIIDIIYGNKIWYLYGASDNEFRNVMPNYLLQWEMIKYAIENKSEIYDFRGISRTCRRKPPTIWVI